MLEGPDVGVLGGVEGDGFQHLDDVISCHFGEEGAEEVGVHLPIGGSGQVVELGNIYFIYFYSTKHAFILQIIRI